MADKIMKYYNEFLSKRMIKYRLERNRRISSIEELVTSYVNDEDLVLDIGCGIGIIVEAIAKKFREAQVIGVDLSPENIWYCKNTISEKNATFFQLSVTEQMDDIKAAAGGAVNLICMVDVIEHIPQEKRRSTLKAITQLAASNAFFILSYPSPNYQRYLRDNEPEELQVIDNELEVADLIEEMNEAGWSLYRLTHEDIWRKDQYIHAVFRRNSREEISEPHKSPILGEIIRKSLDLLRRPYRYFKYVVVPYRNRKAIGLENEPEQKSDS